MVAVSIFAIAGAAILKSTTEHIRSINTLEDITIATWVANNQLTLTLIEQQIKEPQKQAKGDVEMANKTWYWQQEITKTQDPSLLQITIIVGKDENLNEEITAVTSYISKEAG
jgi:general secretion pathway protein I